ncbi:hypothetical protein FRACYDRAFT_244134 [Fragilariopsis cylindrus CCMP1102]|uniref:Lipoyl-binding domain-containing protein n=1 Tax=Fragilariopsis cylindrus CCMP1102 TaxID=635003 RepID=A0A1E7F3V2_9STRA|nr:hypothetical protein FRACYDRAFT_244134 [Fragilariopsis cylindrus CCMP1102]|eukprot:OEU12861.1 hypothetical protein FRACYDRAFT_244134 [Fragilariopsis cylindrus CCMP1102]
MTTTRMTTAFYSSHYLDCSKNHVFCSGAAAAFVGSSSTSKRLMSSSSTRNDDNTNNNSNKEEENSSEKEQESETGSTITGSISFATATDEEYLSSSSSKKENNKHVEDIDYSLYTEPIIIEMPQLDDISDDKTNCYIEEWFKKENDIIYFGDVICDISTPDFSFGMQIDDEDDIGILKEIHIKEDIKVADFTPICPDRELGSGGSITGLLAVGVRYSYIGLVTKRSTGKTKNHSPFPALRVK